MTPEGERAAADERLRVQRTYERYRASERKRRSWDATNPGNAAIRAELVATVFALARDRLCAAHAILDVGCGTGWWLAALAADPEIAAALHGVEMLPDRIASARQRVPEAALASADARELPYEDRSFDAVTLFTVLSSLGGPGDVQRALDEARRVLAPAGKLLVWEPRLANPMNPSTLRISGRSLEGGLAGLRVESRTTTVFPPLARRLGPRTASLYPVLARLEALRTHLLVCATMSG